MKRKSQWSQSIQVHVQNQKSLYIFITVLFMMGVIFGAVIVNTLDPAQKEGLLNYLSYFFQGLEQNSIAESEIAFQHSMGDHLKTIGLMWILGLSVIGIPVLLVFIFLKGLVIGFTVGFLVNQLSWKGLWFAFVSVVPQNLLVIPALIIVAVSGINFSILLVRNRLIHHRGTIYPQFVSFSILVTGMAVMMLLSSLFEAFISPHLMKTAVPPVGLISHLCHLYLK
ncbi:stage II sporulation protein M [Paenactinomyces guangxiensis]|uniref:Stage II sporulation protein M n=1 Tax=Paenactinomyces guangxiensis TaxID=1490290 RepID=A0A7W1WTH7_9BACL|nr:stage II sporulation protein M [Paenactinomyces guangxiensis]MBA4495704.1 stage II sporulation protein M [Paenactinomyces guangxiensis]MBH8592692.1 stage II sporulation protein M [Paenactinomyces guangxiensis]